MKKRETRNKILSQIKTKLSNKQILYSSVEELKEIKDKEDILFETYLFPFVLPNEKNIDKIKEIIIFLDNHARIVGHEQAIRDLQIGLSILNKNRRNSPIEAKNILKDDGIYGNKTFSCLCLVCKNYPAEIIKRYIKLGAKNNFIFNMKNKMGN